MLIAAVLLTGCGTMTKLDFDRPPTSPPEYRQKVGLYVHEQASRFYYPAPRSLDVSAASLMSYHLQQVLPFITRSALQEIFAQVEEKEPGPKTVFKSPDLVGYFEIQISDARYDYFDSRATHYRAKATLFAEFKTLRHETVWRGYFTGEGIGFTDAAVRLTSFGRDASAAIEEAFQSAVDEMQADILKSDKLRHYFRSSGDGSGGDTPNP